MPTENNKVTADSLKEALSVAVFKALEEAKEERKSLEHVYSFSRLSTAECLKRFYHKYVLGEEEPAGYPAILGKVVHEAISLLIEPERMDETLSLDSFDINAESEKLGIDIDEAAKLVLAADTDKVIGRTESHYRISLDPSDPFAPEIQAYLDLEIPSQVEGRGYVTDWKTHHVPYNATDNYQLALYAWILSQVNGYREVEGALRFLRFRGKKGISNHLYTLDDMEEARLWAYNLACDLENRLGQLEFGGEVNKLFPASPESGHCKYCHLAHECQKQSEGNADSITSSVKDLEKGEVTITSQKEAVEVAAEILRLKAAHDKLQDALKNYCKESNNTVIVGDQQYGSSVSVSWSFNPVQRVNMAKLMIDAGINPWEIVSLGTTQLKDKKLAPLGWTEADYKKFGGTQKTITTYRWSKAKMEDKEVDTNAM